MKSSLYWGVWKKNESEKMLQMCRLSLIPRLFMYYVSPYPIIFLQVIEDPRGMESVKLLMLTVPPWWLLQRLETLYNASLPFVDVVWPVSRGCLLLLDTWSYLRICRGFMLPYTQFCNSLLIFISFYTLLTSPFNIYCSFQEKEMDWVGETGNEATCASMCFTLQTSY